MQNRIGLTILVLLSAFAFSCKEGATPLSPASANYSTVRVPMKDSSGHALNNPNVANYTLFYSVSGMGSNPVTGSIGPIPSASVNNYYDFTINLATNNYNYIALQVNDSAAQTVLDIGSAAFTFVPGSTLQIGRASCRV